MRETQQFTAQVIKDVDDNDDGVYLTTACYTMVD